jgi:hypothetical protein
VGIGVHAGETVETAEGYVGSAVNVAARVCAQAGPGELLVTDTVRSLTRTVLAVRFTDRRTRRVKGIAEPLVLYRVEPGGDPSAGVTGASATVATGSRRMTTRRIAAAVLTAALLVVGVALVVFLVDPLRPQASSGADASASPAPTPPASEPPFPTLVEADLQAKVPLAIRDQCVRPSDPDDRIGDVASLRCDLELGAEADTVWYHQFASAQALANWLEQQVATRRLPRGECTGELARAQGNWAVGGTHSGRLLCYDEDGDHWIAWTYDADRILARAARRADQPEDWTDLFDWWRQARLFLR